MIKFVIKYVLDNCPQEIEFLNKFVDKELVERLTAVANSDFGRVTYTDAIRLLEEYNSEF